MRDMAIICNLGRRIPSFIWANVAGAANRRTSGGGCLGCNHPVELIFLGYGCRGVARIANPQRIRSAEPPPTASLRYLICGSAAFADFGGKV